MNMSQRDFVAVVSGLPRSGTSLLMQVLAAGGVPPLTDGARAADEDNPRGYFELERVKRLDEHPELLDAARGRAVKIVAPLLPRLPAGRAYRVLFMHRDMAEVLASQRRMLDRLGRPGAALPDEQLAAAMSRQVAAAIAWCRATGGVELMEIDHRALCTDPRPTCERIDAFLGGGLDIDAMAAVPDGALYRQRR